MRTRRQDALRAEEDSVYRALVALVLILWAALFAATALGGKQETGRSAAILGGCEGPPLPSGADGPRTPVRCVQAAKKGIQDER